MYLADSKEPVSLGSIARQEQLSLAYLERIFALLKKANLVSSVKGASGGYYLTKTPSRTKISDIIKALEGDLYQMECATCHAGSCRIHSVWVQLQRQIDKTLSAMTLKSLKK